MNLDVTTSVTEDGRPLWSADVEDGSIGQLQAVENTGDRRETTVQWTDGEDVFTVGLREVGIVPAYVRVDGPRRELPDDVQDVLTTIDHTVVEFIESDFGSAVADGLAAYDEEYEFSGIEDVSVGSDVPMKYVAQAEKRTNKAPAPMYLTWLYEQSGRARILNHLLTTPPDGEFSASGLAESAPFSADVALDYMDDLVDVGLLEKRLTERGHGRYTFNADSPVVEALLAANAVIANEYDAKRSVTEQ